MIVGSLCWWQSRCHVEGREVLPITFLSICPQGIWRLLLVTDILWVTLFVLGPLLGDVCATCAFYSVASSLPRRSHLKPALGNLSDRSSAQKA